MYFVLTLYWLNRFQSTESGKLAVRSQQTKVTFSWKIKKYRASSGKCVLGGLYSAWTVRSPEGKCSAIHSAALPDTRRDRNFLWTDWRAWGVGRLGAAICCRNYWAWTAYRGSRPLWQKRRRRRRYFEAGPVRADRSDPAQWSRMHTH